MGLNNTQKCTIRGTLEFYFDDIKEFNISREFVRVENEVPEEVVNSVSFIEDGDKDRKVLTALKLALGENTTLLQEFQLQEWGLEDGVKHIINCKNHYLI